MFENAKLFNGPKTPVHRDAEHLQKYAALLRTHFESETLFSMPPMPEDPSSSQGHHKRKRRYFKSRKSNRRARPVLAAGEFGLKDTEEEEAIAESAGVEEEVNGEATTEAEGGEHAAKRRKLENGGDIHIN